MFRFNSFYLDRIVNMYKKGLQPNFLYNNHLNNLFTSVSRAKKQDRNPNIETSCEMLQHVVSNFFRIQYNNAAINRLSSEFVVFFDMAHRCLEKTGFNVEEAIKNFHNSMDINSISSYCNKVVEGGGITNDLFPVLPKTLTAKETPRDLPVKRLVSMVESCRDSIYSYNFFCMRAGKSVRLCYKFKGFTLKSVDQQYDTSSMFSIEVPPLLVIISVTPSIRDEYAEIEAMSADAFTVSVFALEEPNYMAGLYYHPHIRGTDLCLGGSFGPICNYLKAGNFWAIGGILDHILRSYNYQSPYLALHNFDKKPYMIPCRKCGKKINFYDGSMFRCRKCGFVYHRSCLRQGNIQVCDNCLGKDPETILDLSGNIIRVKDSKILYTVKTVKPYQISNKDKQPEALSRVIEPATLPSAPIANEQAHAPVAREQAHAPVETGMTSNNVTAGAINDPTVAILPALSNEPQSGPSSAERDSQNQWISD